MHGSRSIAIWKFAISRSNRKIGIADYLKMMPPRPLAIVAGLCLLLVSQTFGQEVKTLLDFETPADLKFFELYNSAAASRRARHPWRPQLEDLRERIPDHVSHAARLVEL